MTSAEALARSSISTAARWLPEVCAVYPLLLLLTEYQLACLAAVHLGHWPIPSLDDPKSIAMPITVLHLLFLLALTQWPTSILATICAAGSLVLREDQPRPARALRLLALAAASWLITVPLWRADPLRVGEWIMD